MSNWIPLTEKFPEDHKNVLVIHETYGLKGICVAHWFKWFNTYENKHHISWSQDSEWIEVNGDATKDAIDLKVTHWMPLPDLA